MQVAGGLCIIGIGLEDGRSCHRCSIIFDIMTLIHKRNLNDVCEIGIFTINRIRAISPPRMVNERHKEYTGLYFE